MTLLRSHLLFALVLVLILLHKEGYHVMIDDNGIIIDLPHRSIVLKSLRPFRRPLISVHIN